MKEFEYLGLKIKWIYHDCFLIKTNKLTIYTDPYGIPKGEPADLILVSHDHFDHFSPNDIKKIMKTESILIGPLELENKLGFFKGRYYKLIKPWEEYIVKEYDIRVVGIPAYNVNKFRAPGIPFHPKEDNKLGFVFEVAGVKLYHAGDTDNIPEMKKLRDMNIDIAFLPISGTYVMTPEEAVEAVKMIMPKIVIPMHYGAIVAGRREADRFRELMKDIDVQLVILEPEH